MIFFVQISGEASNQAGFFFCIRNGPDLALVFGFFDNKLTDYACIITK